MSSGAHRLPKKKNLPLGYGSPTELVHSGFFPSFLLPNFEVPESTFSLISSRWYFSNTKEFLLEDRNSVILAIWSFLVTAL